MANLSESNSYDAGIYQLETTDPVMGGVNGIANSQAKALANRTNYLKDKVDNLGTAATKDAGSDFGNVPNIVTTFATGEFVKTATYGGVIGLCSKSIADVKTDLSLGNAAGKDVGTTTGTVAAGDDGRLKEVGTTAGTVAAGDDGRLKEVGTTAGTVAAGDDSRFTDAITSHSWVALNVDSPWSGNFQYRKDSFGNVHLRIQSTLTATNPVSSNRIAVLPTGFRPLSQINIPIVTQGMPNQVVPLTINTGGYITFELASWSNPSGITVYGFVEIVFPTD